jgi:hypothetical protein
MHKETTKKCYPNKLCSSCRRTCKQAANAVVAQCPRYYPFNRKQSKPEFNWKQMELTLFGPAAEKAASKN